MTKFSWILPFVLVAFVSPTLSAWDMFSYESVNIVLGPGESYQGRFRTTGDVVFENERGGADLEVQRLKTSGVYGHLLEWLDVPVTGVTIAVGDGIAYRFSNTGTGAARITIPARWYNYLMPLGGMDIQTEDTLCLWVYGYTDMCSGLNWTGYDIDLVDLPVDTRMTLAQFDSRRGAVAASYSRTVAYVLFGGDGYIERIIPFESEVDRATYGGLWLSDYSRAPILVTFHGDQGYEQPKLVFDRTDLEDKIALIMDLVVPYSSCALVDVDCSGSFGVEDQRLTNLGRSYTDVESLSARIALMVRNRTKKGLPMWGIGARRTDPIQAAIAVLRLYGNGQ